MSFSSTTNDTTLPTSLSAGLVVLTVFQILFGITGLMGNFICFTVLRRQSKNHHTNWLIVNQCVADLLTSLVLIIGAIHLNWLSDQPRQEGFGTDLYCRLWDSRVLIFSGFAISTFNLTIISVERYVAVVHPMLYVTRFKRRTLYALAVTAWLTAPTLQIILAATQFEYRDGRCVYIGTGPAVGVGLFIWEFFIPVVIMGYSFIRVAVRLRELNRLSVALQCRDASSTAQLPRPRALFDARSTRQASLAVQQISGNDQSNAPPTRQANGDVRRRNITITLLIVYVSYLVCWTPNQFVFLVFNFGVIPGYIGSTWHTITTILATLNICINPIVYAFKYKDFKRGLKDMMGKCFRIRE